MCDVWDSGLAPSGSCCFIDSGRWYCENWVTEAWCINRNPQHHNYSDGLNCEQSTFNGDCTSCFVSGTIVITEYGCKPIEELKAGDLVASTSVGFNKVLNPINTTLGNRNLISINGGPAFVSDDHPFVTRDGLKSFNLDSSRRNYPHLLFVGQFEKGDEIVIGNGYKTIRNFESYENIPNLPLFNLELDGDHTYLANGYGVHNKSCYDGDCSSGIDNGFPVSGVGSGVCGGFGIFSSYTLTWVGGSLSFDDVGGVTGFTGTIGSDTTNGGAIIHITNDSYGVSIFGLAEMFDFDVVSECIASPGQSGLIIQNTTPTGIVATGTLIGIPF